MQLHLTALAHLPAIASGVLAAASTNKPRSSGSSAVFLIFLLVIVGAYFLFIAPQRRRMRAQMNQQGNFQVGDEIVTKGGVYGMVRSMDGDRVRLEIAPDTTIEVMQTSIARRVDPVVPVAETEDLPESHVEEEGDDLHWQTPEADGQAPKAESNGTSEWSGSWSSAPGTLKSGEEPQSAGPS